MAYQRINFADGELGGTPLDADNLNHIEDGIVANEEAIEEVSETVDDLSTEVEGKQDALTFDNTPTTNSSNPVTSGGIKTALDTKLNKNNPSATGAIELGTGASASSQFGMDSIAIGTNAKANPFNSTAIGHGAEANDAAQVVLGDYNVKDSTSKLIIGGGSDDNDRRTLLKFADSTGDATFCAEVTDGSGNKLSDKIETSDVQNLIESILPTDSASGNPCVITDAFGGACKSLKLTLEPVQSGSGTPSPQNVRPIYARTHSVIERITFNLYDAIKVTSDTIVSAVNGTESANANYNATDYIMVGGGTSYYIKITDVQASQRGMAWYDANKTFISGVAAKNGVYGIQVAPDNAVYMRVSVAKTDSTPCINVSSSRDGEYEPYNGESITRIYETPIYGGSDDVTGDGATEKYAHVTDLSTLTWVKNANVPNTFNGTLTVQGKAQTLDAFCPEYECVKSENLDTSVDYGFAIAYSGLVIYLRNKDCTEVSDLLTALQGVDVIYAKVTPTSIPLTSQNITLLHGDNVLTTDADNIECEYSADIALYIEKKSAEGVNSTRSLSKGGSSEPEEETKEETKEVKKEETKEEEPKEVNKR